MSRYIDADKLLTALPDDLPYKASVKRVLIQAPTADVVEVRHGEWIEHIEKPSWLEDDVEVYYNCSECGTSHWSIIPPYCPECGAKMDRERNKYGINNTIKG